jgi:hypothetical protein
VKTCDGSGSDEDDNAGTYKAFTDNIFQKTVLYLTWQIVDGEFILIISGSLAVRVKNHMVARPPATSGLSQSRKFFVVHGLRSGRGGGI